MTVTLTTATGPVNVIRGTIDEFLEGAWTATVELDSDTEIVGPVTLDIDGTTAWVGSQRRGAEEHGRVPTQLVGGSGGLSGDIGAKAYDSAFVADILGDILVETGEVISPAIDSTILLSQVALWSRARGPGGLSLKQIVEDTTAQHWRIRRDGLVWMGEETYPAAVLLFTEIGREPQQGRITIAPEDSQILVAPGDSFEGRNVAAVKTVIEPGSLRQVITFEDVDGGTELDRKIGPLKRLIETFVGRRIDYSQMYPATVNVQRPPIGAASGTLDVTPDDDRIKGTGFTNVPLTFGTPGMTAVIPSGARVNLYFQNADPKKPRCALFEDGSSVTTVSVGTPAEFVALANLVLTELQSIRTQYNAHVHTDPVSGNTGVPTVLMTAPGSVAGTVLKAK